ncbi:MAG: DUF1016 N-terminal domain-containing protein [Dethiobacteria bacterium]
MKFSARNLRYMNQYYRMFPDPKIVQQLVAQSECREMTQQFVSQELPIFCIPWGYMVQILNKCRGNKERINT